MGCHTWFYEKGRKHRKKDPTRLRHMTDGQWYTEAMRPEPKDLGNNIIVDYWHDLFRIGNYPEDRLYSMEETKAFIEKNNIKDVDWEQLEEFWRLCPNGMIQFG